MAKSTHLIFVPDGLIKRLADAHGWDSEDVNAQACVLAVFCFLANWRWPALNKSRISSFKGVCILAAMKVVLWMEEFGVVVWRRFW